MSTLTLPPSAWQYRLVRSGHFFVALLLHLLLFLMLAEYIIIPAHSPRVERASFQAPPIKVETPPTPPPPSNISGDIADSVAPVAPPPMALPVVFPQRQAQPWTNPAALKNVAPISLSPSRSDTPANPNLGNGPARPFGVPLNGNGPENLVGYLYDLKQNPSRQATGMNDGGYDKEISDFVNGGWNESRFARYYKSSQALSTSTLFIPTLDAEEAPKSFGVEKEVDPRLFVIVYHGTVTPSEDGDYHFVGLGDDVLIVRVDGKNVLDASLQPKIPGKPQKTYAEAWEDPANRPEGFAYNDYTSQFGSLRIGDTFHVRANESVKISVLIGEEHGGKSAFFLMLARDGETYEKAPNGFPKLPLFEIGNETVARDGQYPPFSVPAAQWNKGE